MGEWLAGHADDIAVNFVSGVPFLVFDIIIIALILPVAIEKLNLIRTRRVRSDAMYDYLELMQLIANRFRNELMDFRHAEKWDSDKKERSSELATKYYDWAVRHSSDHIPIISTILDADSVRILYRCHQTMLVWLIEISNYGQIPGFIWSGGCSEAAKVNFVNAVEDCAAQCARLGRNWESGPYFAEEVRMNTELSNHIHKLSYQYLSDVVKEVLPAFFHPAKEYRPDDR
jgi:hypothetical protein